MTPDGRIVRAAVLSGGAAYAAYEVGVLKSLLRGESPATDRTPIDLGVYVGTSGGAVNAAMMVSRPGQDAPSTLDDLEGVWIDHFAADPSTCREGAIRVRVDISRYVDLRCLGTDPRTLVSRFIEDTSFFARFLGRRTYDALSPPARSFGDRALSFADPSALVSNKIFVEVLRRVIDLEGIRESGKAVRIATTNWRTGELRVFANADLTDEIGHAAIQASAAFPGLPPVVIDGDAYVDGGYILNTPVELAISAGADEIHVVYMDPDIKDLPVQCLENAFDLLDKMYHIFQATTFNRSIQLLQDINTALDYIASVGFSPSELRAVLDVLGMVRWPRGLPETPFRPLSVHLYHPREDLGGPLGLLNFDPNHIANLIAKGYADAATHDCAACGCVLSGGGPNGASKRPSATPAIAAGAKAGGGMGHD
jgi:predicted acylesterase/phospholipase RssA